MRLPHTMGLVGTTGTFNALGTKCPQQYENRSIIDAPTHPSPVFDFLSVGIAVRGSQKTQSLLLQPADADTPSDRK